MGIANYRPGRPVTIDGTSGIIAGPGSKAGSRYVQTDAGRFLEIRETRGDLVIIADADTLDRRTRFLNVVESGRLVVTHFKGKSSGYGAYTWTHRDVYHVADCDRVLTEPMGYGITWTDVIAPRPVSRRDGYKLLPELERHNVCGCITDPRAIVRSAA